MQEGKDFLVIVNKHASHENAIYKNVLNKLGDLL